MKINQTVEANEKESESMNARELLEKLNNEACDLVCINVPTGGDDWEIVWNVVEHYMDQPFERIIGFGRTAIDALNSAFGDQDK